MNYPDIFENLDLPTNYLVRLIENERKDLEKEIEKRKNKSIKKTKTELCEKRNLYNN